MQKFDLGQIHIDLSCDWRKNYIHFQYMEIYGIIGYIYTLNYAKLSYKYKCFVAIIN